MPDREFAVKLPLDSIIAPEKLTEYLLKWRPENDKSEFLARAGYDLGQWERLLRDIREQILPLEARFVDTTRYGDVYEVRGVLLGSNGVRLNVVTIWMIEQASAQTKFITLYPARKV